MFVLVMSSKLSWPKTSECPCNVSLRQRNRVYPDKETGLATGWIGLLGSDAAS